MAYDLRLEMQLEGAPVVDVPPVTALSVARAKAAADDELRREAERAAADERPSEAFPRLEVVR